MGQAAKGAFGNDERARFLELIRSGFGVHGALAQMQTHYRRYEQTLKKHRDFARELRHAREHQLEHLITLRYAAAVEGDARAQEFLIGRTDRGREFARAMKARRQEMMQKAGAAEAAAEDVASLRDHLTRLKPDRPDSKSLGDR